MQELLKFANITQYDRSYLFEYLTLIVIIFLIALFIYDKFVQRKNQILISYPVIGHLRYFFYALREPMRQYFGDEKFYKSFDKLEWVDKAAYDKTLYSSFSPSKYDNRGKFIFKHSNLVLNTDEVSDDFSVTFGEDREYPFKSKSIIGRSAMSDGSISPEGTQAFAMGAYYGKFPINTGEGGLTTNFLKSQTIDIDRQKNKYMQIKTGTIFSKTIYRITKFFFNKELAIAVYRDMIIIDDDRETYSFDKDKLLFFRIDWNQPIECFPKTVPEDLPDIIFQMGSGLYGVRDKNGNFNQEKYEKVMKFCAMTEIKIAQGAKQTGGKLLAEKVTTSVAYYRGIEPYKDVISPNRFPYANSFTELFDFVGKLQKTSQKPVGIKIVVSSEESFNEIAQTLKSRIDSKQTYPDFITIDGADGGSATAPLESMTRVGLPMQVALYLANKKLTALGIRDKIKLIVSEKILTPDDVLLPICLGADFVNIARGFMISAGCIRARECSGANGRHCPVGLATQDKRKRASFLVNQKSKNVANYHKNLIKGVKDLLAIMGKKSINDANQNSITYLKNNDAFFHVDDYFKTKLKL